MKIKAIADRIFVRLEPEAEKKCFLRNGIISAPPSENYLTQYFDKSPLTPTGSDTSSLPLLILLILS